MNRHDAPVSARNPMTILTIVVVTTLAVLAGLGWFSYRSHQEAKATMERRVGVQRLHGSIVHLDEVLTMSAWMAAYTGDLQWENRYRRFEPQLDAAIKKVMTLAPEACRNGALDDANVANGNLVNMENRAFELVRQGRAREAAEVLSSKEYELQKQVYADGMNKFAKALEIAIAAATNRELRLSFLQSASLFLVTPLLVVGWLVTFRAVRNWKSTLAAHAKRLVEVNQSLDQRVDERTQALRREICERKQVEAKLRAISDSALDAIVMMDGQGNIAHWNPAAERLFGYTAAESLGRGVHDLLAPAEYCESAHQGLETYVRSGTGDVVGRTIEVEVERKGGSRFPIEMSISYIPIDGRWWAVAIIRDVSTQKSLEAKTLRSLRRFEQLSSLQEDLILPGEIQGKLKRITAAAVRMLDLDFCRIWVTRPADLCQAGCVHAAVTEGPNACRHRDQCLHLLASSGRYTHIDGNHRRVPFGAYKIGRIATGEEKKFLTHQVTTDAKVHDHHWAQELGLVSFGGYKLRDAEGQPIGVLAAFSTHPINEEDDAFLSNLAETTSKAILDNEAERELYEAKDRAEAAARAKSVFLATMSHEIRTPMTAILGFTDMLLSELEDPRARESAEIVKRNGEHLLTIINDILDLSKIESGKVELELVSWSPRQIVAEVVSFLHVSASAKGLTLVEEYPRLLPETITTDPTRLRQVLLNVVGNAIKFTEEGGVRIVARLEHPPDARPVLRFDVIDTGIGIPEDRIEEMFEPFTQGDASSSRKFEGTGLGLAISRRLTRTLGGDIVAQSVPGKGSVFTVTIATGPLDAVPLLEYSPSSSSPERSPAPSPSGRQARVRCRVLLAEDIPDNQRLITSMLSEAGAEVVVAHDGQEVVEKAMAAWLRRGRRYSDPKQPFHVVLMDIQMPLLDGFAATRRLRQDGYTGPIIALTAHAMRDDRQECLDAGFDDYLTKPIDQKTLLEAVRRWASLGEARAKDAQKPPAAKDAGPELAASSGPSSDEKRLDTTN